MGLFDNPTPLTAEQQEVRDFASEFRVLLSTEMPRIKRMEDYRRENEAARDSALNVQTTRDYGATSTQPAGYNRHKFNLPFGKALNVKHSFRIAGRLPDAIVDRRDESADERHRSDTMEKIWYGILRESKGEVAFAAGAWDSSELGAAVFELYWDVARQMPLFRDVDPATCILVRGLNDPHKFQRVYRFWTVPLVTLLAEYRGKLGPEALSMIQANPTGEVQIVQVATPEKTIRFTVGFSQKGDVTELHDVELQRVEHNYGFCNYVVVPNLGPERAIWGWSDYEFVRELIDYICKNFGREADILRLVANGAMKIKGSKLTPAVVKKILAEGGIVPVGKDGDLEPVQAPEVPDFAPQHAERGIQFFEMLGFAPAAAWGDGNAGSGSDRGLQLGPMLELTSMKQINWAAGLSRLGEMAFRMIETKQADSARFVGTHARGHRRSPFRLMLGPQAEPLKETMNQGSPDEVVVEKTMRPKELFDKDYLIRFSWPTRLDPDDPAYVASELNKFSTGVQSARTTLEKFGVESPEEELKLIEQENEDHPWLRQGMLKLLEMQIGASQQGQNDGSQNVQQDPFGDATATMTSKDGSALDADAMGGALGGAGTLFGAA